MVIKRFWKFSTTSLHPGRDNDPSRLGSEAAVVFLWENFYPAAEPLIQPKRLERADGYELQFWTCSPFNSSPGRRGPEDRQTVSGRDAEFSLRRVPLLALMSLSFITVRQQITANLMYLSC